MLATCCYFTQYSKEKTGANNMERSDFIIYFDQVPEGGAERHIELSQVDLELLDLSVSLRGALYAKAVLTRLGRRVLVRGRVTGEMNLECSRCLTMFPYPFSVPVETYFEATPPRASEEEKELTKEDLDVQPLREGAVDLAEIIAEQVHLAVPYRAVCSENCKGMCSRCGVNLNDGECTCGETGTDPRWDALKDLKVH
jgi:uncharacterized protein